MKASTVKNKIKILENAKASGIGLKRYCELNNHSFISLNNSIKSLIKQNDTKDEDVQYLIRLYYELTNHTPKVSNKEIQDTDDRSEAIINRDENNKIVNYEYNIYIKNKAPLYGIISREDMASIYRSYSIYGESLCQRSIARNLGITPVDFRRILRAFDITKASGPFAPHITEELSEEERYELYLRETDNNVIRKIEENRIKTAENKYRKAIGKNIELENQLKSLKDLKFDIPTNIKPIVIPEYVNCGQSVNLYISDLHIGASLTSGALYKENTTYGYDEAKRRLFECLKRLSEYGNFDTINLVLMGDNVDCCGIDGKTARLDHIMPENMDAREQGNKFIELMMTFIMSLVKNEGFCSSINVYSVPCGNHGGRMEYFVNKALLAMINAQFPNIKTQLFEEFFGMFTQDSHTFVVTHGKDSQHMKRGMPLDLNDKTKIMIYEWLDDRKIDSDNIHIIKGDLHSEGLNSCKRFDYRNVLSLFGASDYSNYNFSRNSYGMSFDIITKNNLTRGTFENV